VSCFTISCSIVSMAGSVPQLLQLPDACLLAVLQCCADDRSSLFSAARAHSRLHQAAVLAASSITVWRTRDQGLDSVLLYLANHGQHVSNIEFGSGWGEIVVTSDVRATLQQLPHDKLQGLTSMLCNGLDLQLQPGSGFHGVLDAGMPLQKLHLERCNLLDGFEALSAALSTLPGMQHLSLRYWDWKMEKFHLPSGVLQELTGLTHLDLGTFLLESPDGMRHLQGLTRLQDLRLSCKNAITIEGSMLSSAHCLTRLELLNESKDDDDEAEVLFVVQPAVLAGKTSLRYLWLMGCTIAGDSAGVTEFMSHLGQLKQLTYLNLMSSLRDPAPVASYSALTASSKLHEMDLQSCCLPEGVWQHMFPTGRRLPHLQWLIIEYVRTPSGVASTFPDGGSLVSCCPVLQILEMDGLKHSAGLLSSLTGLDSLTHLGLRPAGDTLPKGLDVLCRLTRLRSLSVSDLNDPEAGLLQLAKLRQLTQLSLSGFVAGRRRQLNYECEVSDFLC
jgi:hypothetical protein